MSQPLSSDEVRRAILKLTTEKGRSTKEENYLVRFEGDVVGRVTIPKGSKSQSPKTFASQCDQAHLTDEEMREGAACRFGRDEYEIKWKCELGIATTEELRPRFERLAREWHKDTGHITIPDELKRHYAYREIIAMGSAVVPLILEDLARQPDYWHWALEEITRAQVAAPDEPGRVDQIAARWIEWGQRKGHLPHDLRQ